MFNQDQPINEVPVPIGAESMDPAEEKIREVRRWEKFEKELTWLINKCSLENNSNTPDFILAKYLTDCLRAFNDCSNRREKWYGKSLKI